MARSVTHFDRAKRSVLLDRRHDLESELTTDPRLPSEVDRDGLTLLHYAAIKDRTDCLKVLVCAGGDCDAASKVNGFTPLHCAADNGSLCCLKYLVEIGANLFAKTDKTCMTARDIAARKNMTKCREYLETEATSFYRRQKEMRQQRMINLQEACSNGDLQTVKDVLSDFTDKGAIGFSDGTNPLYRACLHGHQHITNYLIKDCFIRRWLPHTQTKETPLHACAHNGSIELANLLLVISPEMSIALSKHGEAALHIACKNGHTNLVRLLLNGCAILNINQSESLPDLVQLPVSREGREVDEMCLDVDRIVRFPVADVNVRSVTGQTALMFGCENGHVSVVQLLLQERNEKGQKACNVHISNDIGETALHLACKSNHTAIAEVLLKAGADANAVVKQTQTGEMSSIMSRSITPLVMAAGNGGKDTVRLLLEWGSSDADGDAIQAAQQAGHNDIVQMIISSHGVQVDRDATEEEKRKLERKAGVNKASVPELDTIYLSIKWNTLQLNCLHMPFIDEAIKHFLNKQLIPTVTPTPKHHHVTTIDLTSNQLMHLPDEIFHMPHLQKLNAMKNMISSLPSDKSHWLCSRLQELRLSGNRLTAIPLPVFTLKQLTHANFNYNQILELPWQMWTAPALEKLYVSNNRIKQLPAVPCVETEQPFSDFEVLETNRRSSSATSGVSSSHPSTSSNDSNSKQPGKQQPSHLDTLKCLQRYQTGSVLMPRLNESNQSNTSMSSRGLMTLDVSGNLLTSFPLDLPCLAPCLSRLIAKNNQISSVAIPHGLPARLRVLELDENKLNEFSASKRTQTGPCPRQSLGLSDQFLGSALYSPIKELSCSHTQHKTLSSLSHLSLAKNKLNELNFNLSYPEFITPSSSSRRPSSVPTHNMTEKTEHEDLPAVVCPNLTRIQLQSNEFCFVPDSVCKLEKLNGLDLSHNKKILQLPLEMGRLNMLYDLFLDGLLLVDPPPHIIQQKTVDIIGFLRQRLKQSMPYRRLKLMLVGRHKRGKTSLLQQLIQQGQNSGSQSYWSHVVRAQRGVTPSTNGIDIIEWSLVRRTMFPLKETKVTFMVWDFGGQEEYYATHQCFLSRRSLYLAVWSMEDGLGGIEDLGKWLLTIEARAPSSSVIIVCTFLDCIPESNRKSLMSKYKGELIQRYGVIGHVKPGYPVIRSIKFVSAIKNDKLMSKFRDAVFNTACELEEHNLRGYAMHTRGPTRRLLDQQVPAGFIQVEERAMEVALECKKYGEVPVLKESEFKERVMGHDHVTLVDKESNDEIFQAVQFLHENGIMLHFEDSSLSEYYFLSPQWLCDMLAHIVTIQATNVWISPDGILPLAEFPQVFRSCQFPLSLQPCYLDLLDKFEVAVLVDEENLLVPSRLPDKLPQMRGRKDKLVNSSVCPLHRHYAMPYIPHGMWPRLISRILGDTQLKQFILKQLAQPTPKSLKWHAWKTGAELRWNTQPILRLQETTGSLLSLPDLDPSLINVTVHDSYGAFNTADIIQSSKDVGVQLWVASDPIKACKLSDNDEVPDVNPTFSETIETYSHSASRRYSISAMNDFLVIDTENDEFQNIQDISMEEKRPDHKALDLQGQDLGYETCNQIQSGSTTSSSTNLPEDVNDAETRSVSSFINSYSSFSVTCRPDPLAVKLLTRCVAHIDTILQDWYHGMRNYTVHSFCQDCLLSAFDFYEQSKRRRSQAIELCAFSWKAAVQQAYRSDTISCVRHQDVPLAWIIPDVLFGDLSAEFLIKSSSLKQNHPLGKGGFSDVWSGKWHRQGQPTISVALKMLIRGVTDMNQHKEGITIQESHFVDALPSARSEVSFLSQLNHPHVVNLLGVCIRPLCVVLELAPLGSLEKIIEEYLLARWVISALSSQLVALQVARALDYLHSTMNVIYKDLKSDNVLVWRFPRPNRQKESCDGESVLIKLSDYGISQWANAKGRAKGFGGTEGYIAPEVYRHRGREIFTNKVDIFSYAMVLYELITLQPPMKDIQTDELERAYLSGRRPSMSRQHMDCRIFLRELMFWCWQQPPQDRPTAAETIQALESNQFLRLVGGLPVTERSSIHHAALHRGHRTKAVVEEGDEEGCEEGCEVWICAGDEQLGTVTIVSKHGREIEQEDHSVCDSCIMCICSVNETMWIGSEMGSVYIYSANNRKRLTEIALTQEKRDPVMCIIHASKNRHVIIGMGRGGIHIFSDEISMINKLATPIKSVTLTNRLISCLALVPVPGVEGDTSSDHVTELWCGLTYGEIAVLDPCTLQSKCSALKVVPERQQRQRTRVHNMVVGIVSHLAMDCDGGSRGTRKTVVFCSIIKAGVVIKLFSESREIGGSVNVAGFLTERKEEEYKFSVESLFCQSSRMFVGTRSGHIVVINSETLSLISIFHGFCQSVTCIFAVPKSTWSLLPADFGHTTDEDDAVSGPSSSVPYVVSLGIGLQSYAQEQVDGSSTGFMLVWNVDSM